MSLKVSFLSSADDTPLTKRYWIEDEKLRKAPYPHTFKFNSETFDVPHIKELYPLIVDQAEKHHCLLKGELLTQLEAESRAGSTDSDTPTNWICLDIDGLPGIDSSEELIALIPELKDVSYIKQISSSMGVEPEKGLSEHLFFALTTAIEPRLLKQWLIHLNLSVPLLSENIHLAKHGAALRWPLDITTCQNDKLLYIAPPLLSTDVIDHFVGQRISLIEKGKLSCDVNLNIDFTWVDTEKLRVLNVLRKERGIPHKRHMNTKTVGSLEVLSKPGVCQVTSLKEERGFVYLNLNGGDSWGYYHPTDNSEFIFNFKGEPTYYTRELLPDYAAKLRNRERNQLATGGKGRHYLAITDSRSNSYYRGYYDYESNELAINPTTSLKIISDYMESHGQAKPDVIDEWTIGYDYESDVVFDLEKRKINMYQKSDYMKNPEHCEVVPPVIDKLIHHVMGNDEECVEHFLNWLAVIVQQRKMTGTAWILHGCQGTGKGLLFNYVLAKILGDQHTTRCFLNSFSSTYNDFLESSLLVFIDEVQLSRLDSRSKVMECIKQAIAEPELPISKKYCNAYTARNVCNMIFASNKHDPLEIDPDDRRFNVPPRQTHPIKPNVLSTPEIKSLGGELSRFSGYLLWRPADRDAAGTPIRTEERKRLQELTRDTGEAVADAIKNGDIEFFIDNMPSHEDPIRINTDLNLSTAPTYKSIIHDILQRRPDRISRLSLQILFYYTAEIKHKSTNKFTRYIGHKGLSLTQLWIDDHNTKGIKDIKWKINDKILKKWTDMNPEEGLRLVQPPEHIKNAKQTGQEAEVHSGET